MAGAHVSAIPFVLQLDNYNFDSDPNGTLFQKKMVARRSDGATVDTSTVGLLPWGKTVTRVTYPDGTWLNVYDLISAKTTWRMKAMELAAFKERLQNRGPANCVFETEGNPTFLRSEFIFGQRVAVIQSTPALLRMT